MRHNVALADRVWSVSIMVLAVVFALGLPSLRHTVGGYAFAGLGLDFALEPVHYLAQLGQLEERL
jgi:hypothetical protein